MLDPWIIEEIKRKEKRGRIESPVIQIPVQGPERESERERDREGGAGDKEQDPRGIAIIDFGVATW